MSLTYNTFTTALANFLVLPVTDPNFVAAIPNIIDDAEQRIYRDLDLLNTIVRDASAAFTSGNRNFSLPSSQGTFVVLENINVITPSGTPNPDAGTRNPLLPASKEMLDVMYPSATPGGVPQYFGMITQSTIVVGPWPDAAYQVEVVGTMRPAPLSSANQTTLLSQYLPDLFLDAALVMGAGYLKNFGAATDDPNSGMSWESKYQLALKSAAIEEARKKFTTEGWSSKEPAPTATPPRT